MSKPFMDENFLLETDTARNLYRAAKVMPIYDYHCHLIPSQIAENKQFKDITEIWLGGDHYKWRQMRTLGIEEKYITGDASNYDKYLAWAKVVPNLIGNPLYHWTHLELQRYFGIYEPLSEKTADMIWEKTNALLQTPKLSVKGILKDFNIDTVGTTDDPIDSLEHHRSIADGTAPIGKIETKVIPSYRPDKALNINAGGFADYIGALSKASGITIKTSDDVLAALENRLDYFISLGCRTADHGLEDAPFALSSNSRIDEILKTALASNQVSYEDEQYYKTKILTGLAKLYAKKGIIMQLHLSCIRNINTKLAMQLGADCGIDAVHDIEQSKNLASFLDYIEKEGTLPKTVLYSLNPKDYNSLGTIMGAFQGAGCKGKIQLGSAWWFCDHRDGMNEQMRILANLGSLPAFIGMLTDSRSFLSYPRHEYFRRIMCNLIGGWVENGEYPCDMQQLEKMVKDISFGNAKRYFEE